jgi:hypothetical protein
VGYPDRLEAGPLGWTSRIGALLLGAACFGCAGVGVEYDSAEDFSGYRTWAWLPRLETAPDPYGESREELAAEIEQRTEQALAERGFVRAGDEARADFFVTYHFEIFIEVVLVDEMQAEQHVASMNDSPSYGVTGMETRPRIYQRGHLVIDIADGDERQLVWRGSTSSKYRGSWKPHARAAVFGILERFPPERSTASSASGAGVGS